MGNTPENSDGPDKLAVETPPGWWKSLPETTEVRVLLTAKPSPPVPEGATTEEKRASVLRTNGQGVREIVDFIKGNPDSFPGIDADAITPFENLGSLIITLTPAQCEKLAASGLVEEILPVNEPQLGLR